MPAKSRRQQRYLYWKFGEAWVKKHHFDKTEPKKKKKKSYKAAPKKRSRLAKR